MLPAVAKMMSKMECDECWVELVFLVILLVKIQPSECQGFLGDPPLINYPAFLPNHTLDLRKTNIGVEEVLEGKYELPGKVGGNKRRKKWVLGLYFLTADNNMWQGGVVVNGGGCGNSGVDGGGNTGIGGGKSGVCGRESGAGDDKCGVGGDKSCNGGGDYNTFCSGNSGSDKHGGREDVGGGAENSGSSGDSGSGEASGSSGDSGSGEDSGSSGDAGCSGDGDEVFIWCQENYTAIRDAWVKFLAHQTTTTTTTKTIITLTIQRGPQWVRLNAMSRGREHFLGERRCTFGSSQVPPLKLIVSWQHNEEGAVRKNSEMIKVPCYPLHPLELRASSEDHKMMEAEFDFHPPTSRNNTWTTLFYLYNSKYKRLEAEVALTYFPRSHNKSYSDIVNLKSTRGDYDGTTDPWTKRTSEMITPLSVKFQVGLFGVRVKETTAGQSRLVIHTNKSLPGSPHLRLGVRCWMFGSDCGSVSYFCRRKMKIILDHPRESHNKMGMLTTKLLSLMLMMIVGVAVVMCWLCIQHLNTIIQHFNTIHEEPAINPRPTEHHDFTGMDPLTSFDYNTLQEGLGSTDIT